MAEVTLNQLMEMLQGGVSGLVFRRRPDGKIIVSGAPRPRKKKASAKQKAHRQRFKEAATYARWAARHYPVYAKLAAGDPKWQSPYNFALGDWLKAPVIHRVEQGEGCIRVKASDNIGVTRVRVTVRDEAGTVLERGDAAPAADDWWEFPCQTQGKTVTAEAWDLPENKAEVVVPFQPLGALEVPPKPE